MSYEFHASWHLGLIVHGEKADEALMRIEDCPGCRLLWVRPDERTAWAWLGGSDRLALSQAEPAILSPVPSGVYLSLGGVKGGIEGWRQTHREAEQALAVAFSARDAVAKYSETPLVIAAMHNETLSVWLRDLLTPLRRQSDGGTRTFQALRAYIDAECNHSSAAHALGVGRHTMERRVRAAEELLGCPLRACLPELDVALRLEERNLSGTRFV